MNKRVLIVSPHFPPINAPDHHRVRMALHFLDEFGWHPHVLTVRHDFVNGIHDPLLEKSLPENVDVSFTKALSSRWMRMIGIGNLGLRSFWHLSVEGRRLLERLDFDLVFFSTTMFIVTVLGPIWKKKFNIPYIIDLQDPWLNDYYNQTGQKPPGGRFKYFFSRTIARQFEPEVVKNSSHIITVSPAYADIYRARYPELHKEHFTCLPFGFLKKDYEILPKFSVFQNEFTHTDGKMHWVYVGRGGVDMEKSARILFLSLKKLFFLKPELISRIELHFVGTSYYKTGGGSSEAFMPIAREFDIENIVKEKTGRIPFYEAIKILKDSHAILLMGSSDAGYSASKIYPALFAEKPILAVCHERSPIIQLLRKCGVRGCATFDDNTPINDAATKFLPRLVSLIEKNDFDLGTRNDLAINSFEAKEMTHQLCNIFDKACKKAPKERKLKND